MNTIENRLRKLEAGRKTRRGFTVFGRTEAEQTDQIASLQKSGEATADDLFVCLTIFGDKAVPQPFAWKAVA